MQFAGWRFGDFSDEAANESRQLISKTHSFPVLSIGGVPPNREWGQPSYSTKSEESEKIMRQLIRNEREHRAKLFWIVQILPGVDAIRESDTMSRWSGRGGRRQTFGCGEKPR